MKLKIQLFLVLAGLCALLNTGCSKKSVSNPLIDIRDNPKPTPPPETKAGYKDWLSLEGQYTLVDFDGQSVNHTENSEIFETYSRYYNTALNRYEAMLVFPLYSIVSNNLTQSYQFGPIINLGETTLQSGDGSQVYTYKMNESVNIEGYTTKVNLEMTVAKQNNNLFIQYKIQFDNGSTETHFFTLLKK